MGFHRGERSYLIDRLKLESVRQGTAGATVRLAFWVTFRATGQTLNYGENFLAPDQEKDRIAKAQAAIRRPLVRKR